MKSDANNAYTGKPDLLIYGGTFDPPHAGHQHCIHMALDAFPDSRILVLPGGSPAGVAGNHKVPGAGFRHRSEMCRLSFKPFLDGDRLRISGLEATLPAPNFTVSTLSLLKSRYPDKNLGFMMGDDQWVNFAHWKGPVDILKKVSLIIVPRSCAYEGEERCTQLVASVLKSLGLSFKKNQQEPFYRLSFGTRIYFLSGKQILMSSSGLREALSKGLCPSEESISPEVMGYIRKHNLYQAPESLVEQVDKGD